MSPMMIISTAGSRASSSLATMDIATGRIGATRAATADRSGMRRECEYASMRGEIINRACCEGCICSTDTLAPAMERIYISSSRG